MITFYFIKYLILVIRYTKIVKKIDRDENLLSNLGKLLNCNFRFDWIGRIYAVANPTLDENGRYDTNTQIFEYGANGLSEVPGVQAWLMKHLSIAQQFIQAQNLFDILTFRIRKLDEYNNYLIVFQVFPLADFMRYTKRFLIMLGVLILIGIGLLIFL